MVMFVVSCLLSVIESMVVSVFLVDVIGVIIFILLICRVWYIIERLKVDLKLVVIV